MQKIAKPNTPALHIGSVAHLVLQQWNLARWRREPFHIERFQVLYYSQWTELQKEAKIDWQGEEATELSSSWLALEHYFRETPIKADERPEGVEVYVETDLARHGLNTLVGVLDLVRAGGRIVDFKNSGKTPDPEQVLHQHEIQLTCYGLLYRDATGRTESGFELHHLVRTKTPKFVLSVMGLPRGTGARPRPARRAERWGAEKREGAAGLTTLSCKVTGPCAFRSCPQPLDGTVPASPSGHETSTPWRWHRSQLRS